ncbi:MAG: AAA family ATPase [Lachnospiraceae bacterium]|nr:AAA family ATPase [Lachnospiraceae bacterium]
MKKKGEIFPAGMGWLRRSRRGSRREQEVRGMEMPAFVEKIAEELSKAAVYTENEFRKIYALSVADPIREPYLLSKMTPEGVDCYLVWKGVKEAEYSRNDKEAGKIIETNPLRQSPRPQAPEIATIKLKRVDEVAEQTMEWLFPQYIPKEQITLLVGDGGSGKTSIWCDLIAGVTAGKTTILNQNVTPFDMDGEIGNCLFFSSEDSVPMVLKRRLRRAGADESKVQFIDLADENFNLIKFDSPQLEQLISDNKPKLCVFDPLQSFIPPTVQMGSRNAMRQCLSPLIALGEKYATTFLIVMHTNKKQGTYGRARCADSSDIWDIARSVLIAGNTGENNIRYLSHEKSNYAEQEPTILFTIEDSKIIYQGTTAKRDKDFVLENAQVSRSAPAKSECKEIILNLLGDAKDHLTKEVDDAVKAAGISTGTLKRCKAELKENGIIKYRCEGYGSNKKFYICLNSS